MKCGLCGPRGIVRFVTNESEQFGSMWTPRRDNVGGRRVTLAFPQGAYEPFLDGLACALSVRPAGLLGRIDFTNAPSVSAGASASSLRIADFGLYAVHINA